MTCETCNVKMRKHGKDRHGAQRYRCGKCGRTWMEAKARLLGEMRVDEAKAVLALTMLVEGSSIRSTSRVTGLHKTTLLKLLVYVGERCEQFFSEQVKDVPVNDVQVDEIWAFMAMKEKKTRKGINDPKRGDSFCYVGIERTSKLALAYHVGRRTSPHTDAFVEKLEKATAGQFQLSSDGLDSYPGAIGYHLGTRTDYATLVKQFHGFNAR